MSLLKAIGFRIVMIAVCAILITTLICAMFGVMFCAAKFAFGPDQPPFPWPLVRFFLFIGWATSVPFGLCCPSPEKSEDTSI